MKSPVPKLGNSAGEIEKFIDRLRAVRAHCISVTDWDALRRGEYLMGLTEAKAKRREPGGPGLCCDRLSDKQWEEARLAIAAQNKERTLADTLDSIERERRDAHVQALIAESFATASEAQKETLTREINRYAATDRLEELHEFLEDVRTVGLPAAQSKREHGGRKALWAYALPGIAAVVEVMIAVRILGVVEPGFQTIVVSLLLILYATIAHKIQALQYGVWFFGLDMQRSFLVAYRQLHARYSRKTADERTVPEAIKNLKRSAVSTLVSSCKCSILIVIALWELVKTIH